MSNYEAMKAKYLGLKNPTKKKRKKKKKVTKKVQYSSGIIDQDELNDNLDMLGKRHTGEPTLELEDFENMDEDEKPVFVETEESMKLTNEEKQKALRQIYGDSEEDRKKAKEEHKAGKWKTVKQGDSTQKKLKTGTFEEDKLGNENESPSPSQQDSSNDIEDDEDDTSSSEEERVRHDSSDEEGDEEQIQLERSEREKLFKKKINAALGMDIKSATASEKSDTDSDMDTSSDEDSDLDSGSDEGKPMTAEATLAQRLEELKQKDELMKKMAEKYKNAATVIRGEDGKKLGIKDLQASKEKKLAELNKAMLRQWKSGFKQRQDQLNKKKLEEEGRGEGEAPMGGNIEGYMPIEQELEFMNQDRFEDPLRKKIKDQEKAFDGGYMLTINCKFPGIPNRYGIQPGYMWDGVDRGSGFEKKFLQKMNEASGQVNKEYVEHARHL